MPLQKWLPRVQRIGKLLPVETHPKVQFDSDDSTYTKYRPEKLTVYE